MKSYDEKTIVSDSSATSIPITGKNEIEFILLENIKVEDLGLFISPDVKKLSVVGEVEEETKSKKNQFLALWISLGVLIVLIIYVSLQEWYKYRYEGYLFKNRDDLYNLINFVFNARQSKLDEDQIRTKLKTYQWSGEQINYASKKLDGKRTGLWEIPIFKFIENRKVKKELEKRRNNQADVRFIKRPNF
jgi:hypothetical protein